MKDTDSILHSIEQYQQLRFNKDKKFRKKLEALQKWKTKRALSCYDALMEDKAQRNLLKYYFKDVFAGVDMSELKNAKRVLSIVDKFFTGTEMLTLGMQFNTATWTINERLSEVLFEEMERDEDEITTEAYVAACHRADIFSSLETQLDLFEAFVADLNETVNDSIIVASVKMATIPAKLAGFKTMHGLMADGIACARGVDDARALALQIITHERQVVDNIRENRDPVFFDIQ